MTFDDLQFNARSGLPGVQAKAFFPNGYGVSVIRGFGTYGSELGLYELAVLRGDADKWDLTYDTPVTDDVEGYLTPDDVTRLVQQVKALSKAEDCRVTLELNSAKDVAEWTMAAPAFSQNRTIVDRDTWALPKTLATMVMLLDQEGYIRAFWKLEKDEYGKPRYRWCLHRTKRRLRRDTVATLLQEAMWLADNRGSIGND